MFGIRAGRLFDGVSPVAGQPLVLVEGRGVVAVQTGAQPPAGIEVIDLGAATLLPGLIDTHLHLALDASDDPVGRLCSRGPAPSGSVHRRSWSPTSGWRIRMTVSRSVILWICARLSVVAGSGSPAKQE